MAQRVDRVLGGLLGDLRFRSTPFRIRGYAGPLRVVDSTSALLVWEPRRVTPQYAVRRDDLAVPVVDAGAPRPLGPDEQRRPVLDPSVPFAAHTAPGSVVLLQAGDRRIEGFVCDDADLSDVVLIDFDALSWREEEAEVFAHPRDPGQRIDVRRSGSRLQLSVDGTPVVDTVRARRLWETMLPVRWYVPEEDVLVPLEPSGTVTWCAYKGRATYLSAVVGGRRLDDVAWV